MLRTRIGYADMPHAVDGTGGGLGNVGAVTVARDAAGLLATYQPHGREETTDVARVRDLVASTRDPWSRALPLHLTASALVVHPPSRRVLLRWHPRQQAWLQVGGHGDPGEVDPVHICQREAREETGLADLAPWPDASLVHVAAVAVPARAEEAAHEHADLTFVLATADPDGVRPETPDAPLRWLSMAEANELTRERNLHEMLARVGRLFDPREPDGAATLRPAGKAGPVGPRRVR